MHNLYMNATEAKRAAERYSSGYSGIAWKRADHRNTLISDLRSIVAERLPKEETENLFASNIARFFRMHPAGLTDKEMCDETEMIAREALS